MKVKDYDDDAKWFAGDDWVLMTAWDQLEKVPDGNIIMLDESNKYAYIFNFEEKDYNIPNYKMILAETGKYEDFVNFWKLLFDRKNNQLNITTVNKELKRLKNETHFFDWCEELPDDKLFAYVWYYMYYGNDKERQIIKKGIDAICLFDAIVYQNYWKDETIESYLITRSPLEILSSYFNNGSCFMGYVYKIYKYTVRDSYDRIIDYED